MLALAAFAVALGYFFLAQRPLGKDSPLRSIGSVALPEARPAPAEIPAAKASEMAFSSARGFGFVDVDTLDARHFIGPQGGDATYRDQGRTFRIRTDQAGAEEYDREGRLLWSWEFGSLLTSASIGDDSSAWGCLDGTVLTQEPGTGNARLLRPSAFGIQSARACVYSVAISPDGKKLALIYGQEPQIALFFEDRGSGWGLVHSAPLQEETYRAQAALFSKNGAWAALQTGAGLLVYDSASRTSRLLMEGKLGDDHRIQFARLGDEGIALLDITPEENRLGLLQGYSLEAWIRLDPDSSGLSSDPRGYLCIAGERSLRVFAQRTNP